MIQIVNYAISYVYNCLYPCGEKELKIVVNNDLRSQDAQIGLSITQNSLSFIKDDAAEVRTLISSNYDYYVNLDNLALFQLDLTNYEDDDIMVKVPLISSSIKEFLQNTTIETLGLTKVFDAHFLKKPAMQLIYNCRDSFFKEIGYARYIEGENMSLISGSAYNITTLTGNSAGYSLQRNIPCETATTTGTNFQFNLKIYGRIDNLSDTQPTRTLQVGLLNRLYGSVGGTDQPLAGSASPIVNEITVPINQDFAINTTFSTVTYLTAPSTFSGLEVKDARQRYGLGYSVKMTSPTPTNEYLYNLSFEIEIIGEFVKIDYTLPSILIKDIYDACAVKGITLPNEMNTNSLFITSPNIDKLNNTKVIDIITFLARMQGKIINFTYDSCGLQPFSFIFSIIANIGNEYCKYSKKGFAQTYSYKIGKNPSKMRLANIPEGMWANTYSTAQNSNLLKQDRIDSEIIYDGAEILNILISNDQSVFIIDNSNNNIESDDDTPLNYNFAACVVAKKNLCRMVSNSQVGATNYAPDDTAGTPYTIPNSGGLTTDQSQTYSGYRLAPYTEEMDIPFTGSIINYVLSLGFLCGLKVNGIDYIVESCEFGITPSQVHFVGRRVISA